jgi:hypothetical protein
MAPVPIPEFHAPDFLRPTGEWHKDSIPILSMVACLPTLHMFWVRKRYADVVRGDAARCWPACCYISLACTLTVDLCFCLQFAYGLGFVLAVIYHAMYFSAIGSSLDQAVFLGLTGTGELVQRRIPLASIERMAEFQEQMSAHCIRQKRSLWATRHLIGPDADTVVKLQPVHGHAVMMSSYTSHVHRPM